MLSASCCREPQYVKQETQSKIKINLNFSICLVKGAGHLEVIFLCHPKPFGHFALEYGVIYRSLCLTNIVTLTTQNLPWFRNRHDASLNLVPPSPLSQPCLWPSPPKGEARTIERWTKQAIMDEGKDRICDPDRQQRLVHGPASRQNIEGFLAPQVL